MVTRAHLYSEPISLSEYFRDKKSDSAGNRNVFTCPAFTDSIKNVFVIKNNFESIIPLPVEFLKENAYNDERINTLFPFEDKTIIGVSKPRRSSFYGYSNLMYNLSWGFFSEEPVIARITAPYSPAVSPADGAIMAGGEFDIGQWYRPFNLDYHVPLSINTLHFKQDDPLFFIEIKTNKEVKFNRFRQTPELVSLSQESVSSPNHYGWFKPLSERYKMARNAGVPKQILAEIQKNVLY
jgi:hypothetical protein